MPTATVCDIKVSHIALVLIKTASVPKRLKRTKEEQRYGSASREPMRTVNSTHIWHWYMQIRLHHIKGRWVLRPKYLTYRTISMAAYLVERSCKLIPYASPCIQPKFFHRRVPPIYSCQIVTQRSWEARYAAICSCEIMRFSSDPFSCRLSAELLKQFAGTQE